MGLKTYSLPNFLSALLWLEKHQDAYFKELKIEASTIQNYTCHLKANHNISKTKREPAKENTQANPQHPAEAITLHPCYLQ